MAGGNKRNTRLKKKNAFFGKQIRFLEKKSVFWKRNPFFGKTNPQITAVPSFLEYRRTKLSSTGLVSQQT
jgi:hypothetical protein